MTDDQAVQKSNELKAWKSLRENPAYRVVEARIRDGFDEASTGLSDRQKTAEKRAEHLEAYHLAKELLEMPEATIKALTHELDRWRATQFEVPMGIET